MRRAIYLSGLALLTVTLPISVPTSAQSPDLFVEVAGTSPFFTGDLISVTVLTASGGNVFSIVVEVMSDGVVVREFPVGRLIAAPGSTVRDGTHFFTAGLGDVIDERYPPGFYQVRARAGSKVSAPAAFAVEPWGQPKGGLQVSLTGPAAVTSGEPVPLTAILRNVGPGPLRVPSGAATFDCEWGPFQFALSDASPHSSITRGLSGNRKDCKELPRVLLQPNETSSFDVDLTRLYVRGGTPNPVRPLPGTYRIHVSVRGASADTSDPLIWKDQIRSNFIFIDAK